MYIYCAKYSCMFCKVMFKCRFTHQTVSTKIVGQGIYMCDTLTIDHTCNGSNLLPVEIVTGRNLLRAKISSYPWAIMCRSGY